MWDELPWVIGLFVAVVFAAALVNRLRPRQRSRIRRLVIMFSLYTVSVGLLAAAELLALPTWAATIGVVGELLKAYVLVSLGATLVFAIALPLVRVDLPLIASDLLVGLGMIAVTLVVLARNGMNPTNALVSGAVVSAVLAISLQSTLGNLLGGIALQLDGSIDEGDWIQFDQARVGRVRSVRWRHTVVETRDGATIIVPNSLLLAQAITILGKKDGQQANQQIAVPFNVSAKASPSRVVAIVGEAMRASPIENVASEPAPLCVCLDLAKDTREGIVSYLVRYAIIDLALEEATSSAVRARVFAALRRDDIQLAMPALIGFADVTDEELARRADREAAARLAVLRQIALFHSFSADELATLARGMRTASYAAGERVFRQGDEARELFILASGRIEIRTTVDPDGPGPEPERPLFVSDVVAPGFFGASGLMTGEPRSADAIATADAECYRLDKATFEQVLLARPAIAQELSERLAHHQVELEAARDGLDAQQSAERRSSERERLRRAIQSFFGL